jgi:hypothetical protein
MNIYRLWILLMNRRCLLFLLVIALLALMALPLAAQEQEAPPSALLPLIPAESAGYVALRADSDLLTTLVFSFQVSDLLQPTRVDFGTSLTASDFFPLDLFDLENASFAELIQPWLGDEIVFVYRELSPAFALDVDHALVMFETVDAFQTLATLRPVLEGQDLPQGASFADSETYRDTTIYRGDKTHFAVTPQALLLGSREMILAALDTAAGEAVALTAVPTYNEVVATLEDAPITLYMQDDAAANALSALIGTCENSADLYAALGNALGEQDNRDTLLASLLKGDIDGVGVTIFPDVTLGRSIRVAATVHTAAASPVEGASLDADILNFIPRNAAAVQSGGEGALALQSTLLALPLANFAGCAIGGFPVEPTAGSEILPAPEGDDLLAALESFDEVLQTTRSLSLQDDLVAQFDGSYAVAILPRPNAPVPFLNTRYELLIVAQVDDGDDARAAVATLVQSYLPAEFFVDEVIDGATFSVLRGTRSDDAILTIGAMDEVLLVGTGNAVSLALDAQRGDNRLVDQPRWQALSADQPPLLYVDINPFNNTFFPQLGGLARVPIDQVGLTSYALSDGLFALELLVTLPAQ